MFIKYLTIESPTEIIREIEFKLGLNLIIDNTPVAEVKLTGNNVGKTTVLKLVDVCLGAKQNIIYKDTENKKEVYDLVRRYLIEEKIIITLTLVEDLRKADSRKIIIKRNFLLNKKALRSINGKDILDKEFDRELLKLLIPHHEAEKPTFRQIISHNIRYKDEHINNTLKTLSGYTSSVEYEYLYLFLLGCKFADGENKQTLLLKFKQEETFKRRLEKKQNKVAYEMAVSMLDDEIALLNKKKASFNLNENFEADLEALNFIKYEINRKSSSISKLKIRKELIETAKKELEAGMSFIDLKQLENLYSEVSMYVSGIQKKFSDLVTYHNNMIVEKAKFIAADLPTLNDKIFTEEKVMNDLLRQEQELSTSIAKGDSFAELENIIGDLNEKYRLKGEYESIIEQLNEIYGNINELTAEIKTIDDCLFANDFEETLKGQIKKFNKHFSFISQELYGEKYALKYDRVTNKNNPQEQVYKFSAFNTNMSSGKKQGEILCFDLAYLLFADAENIPCLHFLLNDKKELLHDNQLIKAAEFVHNKNVQLIASILRDKLPEEIMDKAHIALELSQDEKLFKIEKSKWYDMNSFS